MFWQKKTRFAEGMLIGLAVGGVVASGAEMMMNKDIRKSLGKCLARKAGMIKAAINSMGK